MHCRFTYFVLGRDDEYFVEEHSDSKRKYSEDDTVNALEFLVDIKKLCFVGEIFQQIIGIPMGTYYTSFLADIFLYSYEKDEYSLLEETFGSSVLFTLLYRYFNDILSFEINPPP